MTTQKPLFDSFCTDVFCVALNDLEYQVYRQRYFDCFLLGPLGVSTGICFTGTNIKNGYYRILHVAWLRAGLLV